MSALAARQSASLKRYDAATYRKWASECPLKPWAAEYLAIAARLEAEAEKLERSTKELADVHH